MIKIVGILNITPDSFSDGGQYNEQNTAINRAEFLYKQGAFAIDIGAESTRPNAKPISAQEEWDRLENILHKILAQTLAKTLDRDIAYKLSIDTKNIETVEKSLKLGVKWINDVSGIANSEIINLVKFYNAKITIMHNLGIPADKNIVIDKNKNVIDEIYNWGKSTIQNLLDNNIDREKIIFDPGIGFGKTSQQSIKIINKASFFKSLNVPIMIGHSRKSFLELLTSNTAKNRDNKTVIISKQLAKQNIDYIRVHNVKDNLAAITD